MSGEQFLEKTMTVVGKHSAISDKNEEFLLQLIKLHQDVVVCGLCGLLLAVLIRLQFRKFC